MTSLLVVIPVWPGDYERVLSNVRAQSKRDGKTKHHALIVTDQRLPNVPELSAECRNAFASVAVCLANAPKLTSWPTPQNNQWQSAARLIESAPEQRPWFWWESDVVPLKPGWLDALLDGYRNGRRPFMGHVVEGRGHMNGVAVYPPNISVHCTKAMITKAGPFDVVLSQEVTLKKIARGNDLIVHHLKARGSDPARPLSTHIRNGLPETAVVIHGYYEPSETQTTIINQDRRRQAMNETSKAMRRRRCEEAAGGFKWSKVFTGSGVDVGAGNDPVQIPGCKPFDMLDGDANYLSRYIPKDSLDYVHASQCLEHMVDPRSAILNWATCVKKGGHIVVTVPSFTHYEKRCWPSKFNTDHKTAWSMEEKGTPYCKSMIHIPTFVEEMSRHGLLCHISRLVDTNYDYSASDDIDQTYPEDGAECFYEMVFKKA